MSKYNDNIVPMGGFTRLDLPVDRVLDSAKNDMKGAIIIGYDHEDRLYFASTYADGGEILWLLEQAKYTLLDI